MGRRMDTIFDRCLTASLGFSETSLRRYWLVPSSVKIAKKDDKLAAKKNLPISLLSRSRVRRIMTKNPTSFEIKCEQLAQKKSILIFRQFMVINIQSKKVPLLKLSCSLKGRVQRSLITISRGKKYIFCIYLIVIT